MTVPGSEADEDGSPETEHRVGPGSVRRELFAFAELFAIAGLAFAQPAFDLLSKNVSVLIDRDAVPWQVVGLTCFFLFAPVVPAYLVEVLAGVIVRPARRWVHAMFVGLFGAVAIEETLKQAFSMTPVQLVVAGGLGGISIFVAVMFVDITRTFLRILAIAPAAFAVMFLAFSPVSRAVIWADGASASGASIGSPHRVVMIVMDEFPLGSLLDGSGQIDRDLYPNFATLADASTWYRRTTTVSPFTDWAVPALATGRYPSTPDQLPIAGDHPDSLFRLLGGAYRMNVHDSVTDICSDDLCPDRSTSRSAARNLALMAKDALELWSDFAHPEPSEVSLHRATELQPGPEFRRFNASLKPGTERMFDYVHVLLPHVPWRYLPSLQDNGYPKDKDVLDRANLLAWESEIAAQVGRQRYILQTQAADALLGQTINRLKRVGAWDDSIFVVTADHGISFTPGQPRRSATAENADEILSVPLFIKTAGQARPRIDDRPMETIDIVPTIADLLDLTLPWRVDGVSALTPPRAEFDRRLYQWKEERFQPESALIAPDGEALTFPAEPLFERALSRQAAPPVGDPALRPYRIGEYGSLIGEAATPLIEDAPDGPTAYHTPDLFQTVDPSSPVVPWVRPQGSVVGLDGRKLLAFAVNGVIAGFGPAVPFEGKTVGTFYASLAPQFFRAGANDLQVFVVSGPRDAPRLDPIPPGEDEPPGQAGLGAASLQRANRART